MVASCMLSGSCLFILGLGLLSCVTHASPISAGKLLKIENYKTVGQFNWFCCTYVLRRGDSIFIQCHRPEVDVRQ